MSRLKRMRHFVYLFIILQLAAKTGFILNPSSNVII